MQAVSVANVSSSLDSKTWRSDLVGQQDKDSKEIYSEEGSEDPSSTIPVEFHSDEWWRSRGL